MLAQRIQQHFFESADLQYQAAEPLARSVAEAASAAAASLTAGGKLLCCGHAGGAPLARHVAELLTGRLERERPPLAAMCIEPLPRQVHALGLPGDLLLLVDPSSLDLDATIAAVRAAQGKDMTAVLVVGVAGAGLAETLAETDVLVVVPHEKMTRVLEAQLVALHALCDAVDVQLMGDHE